MAIPSILCVDDESAVLQTTRLVLERAGYCVSAAATAEDALWLLRQKAFDLMLIDRIPECEWVVHEAKRANPNLRVAVLTGDSELRSLPLVDVVLSKPVPPPALLNIIAELLLRVRAA